MLKQGLQQKLLQKLSPQQIQFIKLLQVPTVMLDSRIKEELEENPALEDGSLSSNEDEPDEYSSMDEDIPVADAEESHEQEDEFNVDEYIQDDDIADYRLADNNYGDEDDEKKEQPIIISNSFHEQLEEQLGLCVLNDHEYHVGEQIIGSIDDDGYLRRPINAIIDDLAFSQNITTTKEEVEHLLSMIQKFDPAGVGARDLKECLLLQLQKKDHTHASVINAIRIIQDHLDEFTRKHYDKLERTLNVSAAELKEAVAEIIKLNPRPGNSFSDNIKQLQVIPDFTITNNEGILSLTLNSRNAPELKVSRTYKEMFDTYDKSADKNKKMKEAVQFVKQKLDSAKWFIDAIKQRQQTLLKTMNAIMQFQYDFFIDGDKRKLKPMILKDIADQVEMDISTISRVANSKYVQTEFGTFLLKSFFSEAIQTDNGEEVSNKEVKMILEECIGNESKKRPLADEKLADILQKKGYNIARRTVAKYREQMNIPVARLRKEL